MEISDKGRAAESLVKADLEFGGYVVFTTGESKTTIDLIAQDTKYNLIRIQVKSFSSGDDRYDVDIRRPHAKIRHYKNTEFDVLAIVDINARKIVYLNFADLERRNAKRSVRIWRKPMSEYSAKYKGVKLPIFFEEYNSFENAIGKRFSIKEAK